MSDFDKDLKEGDLILAYHSGIHRVFKIERRFVKTGAMVLKDELSSLIHYETILTATGKKTKKLNRCDARFCQKLTADFITESRKKELKAINDRYDAMKALLKG